MSKKQGKTPFGIQCLVDVPEGEMKKVNGGRRHHHRSGGGTSGGGGVTTQFMSMPQPAFPQGDSG